MRASTPIQSPTGSRDRWIVRSVLTNSQSRHGRIQLRPLAKSAAAATRASGDGGSPGKQLAAQADPRGERARAELAGDLLDLAGVGIEELADVLVEQRQRRAGLRRRQPGDIGRRDRSGGQVGSPHAHRPREAGVPVAGVERRLDDLKAPARPHHASADRDRPERYAAEEVDRQARHDEVRARRGGSHRSREQRRRRTAVHHPLVPRPAGHRRGDEPRAVGREEGWQGHRRNATRGHVRDRERTVAGFAAAKRLPSAQTCDGRKTFDCCESCPQQLPDQGYRLRRGGPEL